MPKFGDVHHGDNFTMMYVAPNQGKKLHAATGGRVLNYEHLVTIICSPKVDSTGEPLFDQIEDFPTGWTFDDGDD